MEMSYEMYSVYDEELKKLHNTVDFHGGRSMPRAGGYSASPRKGKPRVVAGAFEYVGVPSIPSRDGTD
jgi:hypothetical protein